MPTIDELGTAAAARLADHVRAGIDVEARLGALHASGMTVSKAQRVPVRAWGAAASVAIIAIGAVGLFALRHSSGAVSPSPTTASTSPSTTAPIETVPSAPLDPIVVSQSAPPPVFVPRVFATVSADAQIGLTETGAVVVSTGAVQTVDWDGTWSDAGSISWNLTHPVAFQGVVYGLAATSAGKDALVMVAAPLRPGVAGVLSTTPVSGATYADLPASPFGLGRDGIVDRVRDLGTTLVPYASYRGSSTTFDGAASATIDDSLLVTSSSGQRWQLAIERDPAATNDGQIERPLPGGDGSIVLFTTLAPTQPVIAELDADGAGRWWSLPEGWTLAASDVFGTILQRRTDSGIELARFPDTAGPGTTAAAFDPAISDVDVAPRTDAIGVTGCNTDKGQYCEVDSLEDGRLIVHRWSTDSFVILGADGREQEVRLDRPADGWMIAVGPDDVVYVATDSYGGGETAGDIVAYRLDGAVATEITRARSVTDPSGDSDIVATRDGLVVVGCCGGSAVRPDPSSEPAMRWVDRSGATVVDDRPFIRVENVDGGVAFVRQDRDGTTTRWPSSGAISATIRGMPGAAALADGGAIVTYWDPAGTGTTFLRLRPWGAIERTISPDVFAHPTRSGRLFDSSADGPREIALAGLTEPSDAMDDDLPTGSSANAVIDALLARLQPRDDCEASRVALLGRSGSDPVIATIGQRLGCDDSAGGQNVTYTIRPNADRTLWSVTAASKATLCLQGVADRVCV